MPTNTSITSALSFPGQVPPDRDCDISTLTNIIQGVVDFTTIESTSPDGTVNPPDNSIANQALSTANAALALAQSVQASQKEMRSGVPQPIGTGESQVWFPFGAPMPDTNYAITVTLYAGVDANPASNYSFRVVESSITVNGFAVNFANIIANTKAGYLVVQR